MGRLAVLALGIGLGTAIGLILWTGTDAVAGLLAGGGWTLLLVPAFHLLPMLCTALAWRSLLMAQGVRQPWWRLGWYRWLADSINALLPVAQIGGEVVRSHLLARRGVPGTVAAASVIVDLTAGLATLVAFILGGLGLAAAGREAAAVGPLALGVAVFGLLILGFYRLQRSRLPLRLAQRLSLALGGPAWSRLAGGTAALDGQLSALYARPGALARCAGWRMTAWIAGALEMALAATLLGHAVGLRDILIFEAVSQAFRNAGFAIPGALGVQEGGMMLAGTLIGLPPELGLTLALVKRMRDLVLGVPALVIGFPELALGRKPQTPPASGRPPGGP